ncbi:hypothetical protein DPMN_013685, partial [Dreissena polymorpha]
MNEISSCKDTPPHWTNEITLEMYVNKGFKRRWTYTILKIVPEPTMTNRASGS